MKELTKILNSKNVSLETKAKIIHYIPNYSTVYGYKSWTGKKTDRKKVNSFEMWLEDNFTDNINCY